MKNEIQNYPWGSFTALSKILNQSTSDKPQAELWLGGHPKASSKILIDEEYFSLYEKIKENPSLYLGKKLSKTYENLPFLFKILCAETPLSIQAHPNLEQAKKGYKKENEQKIPKNNFCRNYKDDNHKPEILVALTDFEALCGFRDLSQIVEFMTILKFEEKYPPSITFLHKPNIENFKRLFEKILRGKKTKITKLITDILEEITKIKTNDTIQNFTFDWIFKLNKLYPNDVGVLAPIFLNTIKIKTGEAVFIDAGILHAYLKGVGVEVMANSDNVLRGGLTPKNIDIDELLQTLTFEVGNPKILRPIQISNCEKKYDCPTKEFKITKIKVNLKNEITTDNAQIIFCLKGEVKLNDYFVLKQGESAFIVSANEKLFFNGKADLFLVGL